MSFPSPAGQRLSVSAIATSIGFIALITFFIVYHAMMQDRIELAGGIPYDAAVYHAMAENAGRILDLRELRPFAYRIGTPWIVGTLFEDNLIEGFRVINLLAGLLTLPLLYLLFRRYLHRSWLVLLLLLVWVVNPSSPFRLSHLFPVMVDPLAMLFVVALLYLSVRRVAFLPEVALACLLTVTGVLIRELVLCAALLFSFTRIFRLVPDTPWLSMSLPPGRAALASLPFVSGVLMLLLLHWRVEAVGEYTYLSHAGEALAHLWSRPGIYPLAWLTAFGPLLLLLIALDPRKLSSWLFARQELMLYLAGMAVLALVGGFHTDRLLYWSFPATLILIGHSVAQLSAAPVPVTRLLLLFLLCVTHLLAFRVFWPIPGGPLEATAEPGLLLLTPFGDGKALAHMYAAYMAAPLRQALLLQYLVVGVLVLVLMWSCRAEPQGP